jgi:outer membrane protein assembly factor BamB
MKKKEDLKAAIIIAIIVAVVGMTPIASASDWQQFQKDNINSGYTTDNAPVSNPELAWSKYTNSGIGMGSGIDVAPIVADGAVYVLDCTGILWSFDAKTGMANWNVKCNAASGGFELSVPAYHDGIVYVASSSSSAGNGSGRVNAIYANNGTIRECAYYGLSGFQLNTPVTYADGKIYLGNGKISKDISTYYCIDASDVTNEIWNRTAPYFTGYHWAGAAIIEDYIVYGDDSSIVTCLYKDNGTFVDSIDVSTTYGISVKEIRSSIVWNDEYDRIYFSSKGGYAFAIGFDQTTGHFIPTDHWSTYIGDGTSTPAVYDGRLYVGQGGFGATGMVYCLSESDGSAVWSTPNLGGVQSSPALSIVDGRKFIYFTVNNYNGSAYCLEDTGSTYTTQWIWNPPDDDQYILQGMAISDGYVYFGTDAGYVYALQEAAPSNLDINTDVALNGDVNISWGGTATNYDIYIADTYSNFGKTPAVTVTDKYWIDTDASDHPKERYYKVAYNVSGVGQRPGDGTVGYYKATAKFATTLLSVPHVVETADINNVLKYNHAPVQRLTGGLFIAQADKVRIQKDDGTWATVWLRSTDGLWYEGMSGSTREMPSDIGFRVEINTGSGHTVSTNVVYRMLMRDSLGDLIVN